MSACCAHHSDKSGQSLCLAITHLSMGDGQDANDGEGADDGEGANDDGEGANDDGHGHGKNNPKPTMCIT